MLCGLWDLSSLTRDGTQALVSESDESQSLDCQGISCLSLLFLYIEGIYIRILIETTTSYSGERASLVAQW